MYSSIKITFSLIVLLNFLTVKERFNISDRTLNNIE